GNARVALPQRQPVAAQAVEAPGVEAVSRADAREVLADARPLLLPRADAHVDVVALREHPAVAAGDVGELDHRAARIALAVERVVADVPLVRHAVDDRAAEPERLRRRAVRAVRA